MLVSAGERDLPVQHLAVSSCALESQACVQPCFVNHKRISYCSFFS